MGKGLSAPGAGGARVLLRCGAGGDSVGEDDPGAHLGQKVGWGAISSAQLSLDSRYPSSSAMTSLVPSARAHEDQHGQSLVLQAHLEVDPVGPHVRIVAVQKRTGTPALVVLRPGGDQSRDGTGRKRGCSPRIARSAGAKSEVDRPRRYSAGSSSARLWERRRYGGRMPLVKR